LCILRLDSLYGTLARRAADVVVAQWSNDGLLHGMLTMARRCFRRLSTDSTSSHLQSTKFRSRHIGQYFESSPAAKSGALDSKIRTCHPFSSPVKRSIKVNDLV
jgi:hypothetical protein